MYTEDEILSLVKSKAEVFKNTKKGKQPDFGVVHSTALRYKKKLMPHYDPDCFPEMLFKERAPNQSVEEQDYIRRNHKAITYVVWDRFKTTLRRIWNDANWSISEWGKIDARYDSLGVGSQEYFEEQYPIFDSLENYYRGVVTDTKEKDPNAVLVHKPESIPVKESEEGYIIDDQAMINPVAYIFPCEQVMVYFQGQYFLGLSDENSVVESGSKKERTGLIFEFYDTENIYLVKQFGKKEDYTFVVELYWNHGLGYLPCKILKAEPSVIGSNIVYKSHFMPAVEPLDLALLDNANLLVAKNRHVFPKFWEYQAECDYQSESNGNCQGGFIYGLDGAKSKCPQCKGTGHKSISPFGTYAVPMPDRLNPENANVTLPPAGYIQPEIETPKFLDEQIDKNINRGLSILNLNVSNSSVKGSDTALGMQIDREEQFSFLVQISSQIFHLFDFSLMTIQKMRYGVNAESPKVNYPKNFSIRNEYDLTEEISNAKTNGMPDIGIRQLIIEYFNTRFNNNELASKVINLVFYADRLVTLSNQEIATKLSTGAIAKWEDILHTSITQIIQEAMNMDDNFMEKTLEEQRVMIVEKAKAIEVNIAPKKIDTNAILANANA